MHHAEVPQSFRNNFDCINSIFSILVEIRIKDSDIGTNRFRCQSLSIEQDAHLQSLLNLGYEHQASRWDPEHQDQYEANRAVLQILLVHSRCVSHFLSLHLQWRCSPESPVEVSLMLLKGAHHYLCNHGVQPFSAQNMDLCHLYSIFRDSGVLLRRLNLRLLSLYIC
jgi:hypothetical protein